MTPEIPHPAPAPIDPALANHLAAIRLHFQPVGAFEESLVDQIAMGMWRLQRCAAAEEGIFAADSADAPDIPNNPGRTWLEKGKAINALSLYEARIRRALEKDKAELRAVQAERQSAAATKLTSPETARQPEPVRETDAFEANFAVTAGLALPSLPCPSPAPRNENKKAGS